MMICKIVQNEGFVYTLLLACIGIINCAFVGGNSQTIQELCTSNKVSFNVKPGETKEFHLTSANFNGDRDKWYQKLKRKCYKEFHSNNGASHFVVVISNMTIPTCEDQYLCNYFEISEAGYGQKFYGITKDNIYFESKSDYIIINFYHKPLMPFQVSFSFTVKRNTFIITGSPKSDGRQSGQFLETPYFPNTYPLSYAAEYILQSNSEKSHVMLMFVDFKIASLSHIEVFGHNGTHPAIIYGNTFRPPVFVSEKNRLSLKFQANNQNNIGFRALCLFLKDSDLNSHIPYTGCGGLLTEYGGSVSLKQSGKHHYYDCVWHLLPSMFFENNYLISISNITFGNTGSKVSLEFREGLSSKSTLVRNIDFEELNSVNITDEITVSASKGLYVRFNGYLDQMAFLHMVYSTYYIGNCTESHLICNDRCLSSVLRCDGVANCFDGMDEKDCSTIPSVVTVEPTTFKKRHPNEKVSTAFYVVIVFGTVGILVVILVVIFVFYRFKKVYSPELHQEQSDSVNEMTGPVPILCPQVSLYLDEPPSYEDFILAADCYPPALYTRATKRYSEPFMTRDHTTSFCSRSIPRHPLAHSIDLHSLNSSHSGENSSGSELLAEPGCSFGTTGNTELIFHQNRGKDPICLKRSASLNSGIDQVKDAPDCHFHLSITHSVCSHSPDHRYQSLPTNLKVSDRNPNGIDITFQTSLTEGPGHEKQGFSSCVCILDTVSIKSEVQTTVKARCQSDPCRKVSLSYSLHCKK